MIHYSSTQRYRSKRNSHMSWFLFHFLQKQKGDYRSIVESSNILPHGPICIVEPSLLLFLVTEFYCIHSSRLCLADMSATFTTWSEDEYEGRLWTNVLFKHSHKVHGTMNRSGQTTARIFATALCKYKLLAVRVFLAREKAHSLRQTPRLTTKSLVLWPSEPQITTFNPNTLSGIAHTWFSSFHCQLIPL